jgi:centromere protein I
LIDEIGLRAYDDGLLVGELNKLIDVITLPNELDQASLGNLIRNLYPVGKIPESTVLRVISSLGNGRFKPPYNTQAGLLKWLVMVYDVMENPKIFSQLYHIIFNLLDTAAIRFATLLTTQFSPLILLYRPQVCHVLALITRRKHVRPFRIQFLWVSITNP